MCLPRCLTSTAVIQKLWAPKLSRAHHIVAIPELSYPVGVTNNIVYSFAQPPFSFWCYPLSEGFNTDITCAWNWLDGVCVIVISCYQIYEGDYAKGFVNLISGISLLAFTQNQFIVDKIGLAGQGATFLAGPVFAFSMLCDLISAAINHYQLLQEQKNSNIININQQNPQLLSERLAKSRENLWIKLFSFTGMTVTSMSTFFALCGANTATAMTVAAWSTPIGSIITAGVACYYVHKYFFKPTTPDAQLTQEELSLNRQQGQKGGCIL